MKENTVTGIITASIGIVLFLLAEYGIRRLKRVRLRFELDEIIFIGEKGEKNVFKNEKIEKIEYLERQIMICYKEFEKPVFIGFYFERPRAVLEHFNRVKYHKI